MGREALLDDIGRLVRAEIRAEFDPLFDVQEKTQHQVAELYTQQDELWVKMAYMELEAQRNTGLIARRERRYRRPSKRPRGWGGGNGARCGERSATTARADQGACRLAPHPRSRKVRVAAAQVVSRDSAQVVLAQQCSFAGMRSDRYELHGGRQLSRTFTAIFIGESRLAARRAAMLLALTKDAEVAWR